MQENLVFELIVPIDMPEINQTSAVYQQVLNAKIDQASEVITKNLPDDWEWDFRGKY